MKPPKEILEYYDWFSAWDYIQEEREISDDYEVYNPIEGELDDVWHYLIDVHGVSNGMPFTLSNWEVVYDNGRFAGNMCPRWIELLEIILDEFGEIDKQCLTPNTKTANFIASW